MHTFLGGADHATGALVALLGYLAIAAGAVTVARSSREEADTRGFIDRVFSWRTGMPLVVLGGVFGLISVFVGTWFSPSNRNDHFFALSARFSGSGVNALTSAYITWLGLLLFLGVLALAAVTSYLERARLAVITLVLGIVAGVVTLVRHARHRLAWPPRPASTGSSGAWANLGVGGWLMAARVHPARRGGLDGDPGRAHRPGTIAVAGDSDQLAVSSTNVTRVVLVVVIATALFYPPMATQFWQTVLVTEIGIYVLLAIGLNVVVGWAGLLDLGFIAFYAIGSYTTAYFTGRLPVHPPDWLVLTPLQTIPFAVVICLLAGLRARRPDPAAARRLPGHRDARLR